jgi:hypothetical protein
MTASLNRRARRRRVSRPGGHRIFATSDNADHTFAARGPDLGAGKAHLGLTHPPPHTVNGFAPFPLGLRIAQIQRER